MAAAEISALLDLLLAAAGERDPPVRRLRLPAARAGLEALAGALAAGSPADPSAARAILAASRAVVSAVLAASVEQVEQTVVEIVERSLEFCLFYLEKSSYVCDDFGLLNEVASFMESVLLKGTHGKVYSLEPSILNDINEQWTSVQVEAERLSPQEKYFCYLKGFDCSKSGDDLKRFRLALSPEYLRRDYVNPENIESCSAVSPNGMVPLVQHFAVVHLYCIPRLLTLVQKLCQSPALEMVEDINSNLRLSFTQRILKLVCGLAREFPSDASDAMMLSSVARCADSLPALFRLKFKFSNHERVFSVDGIGTILLQILEEFLQLIQIIVCNSDICCTVQVCTLASMLEIFRPNIWRYEKSGACLVPPLAYSPHVVQYVLKLLKDTERWTSRVGRDKPDKDVLDYSCNRKIDGLSCHVRSEVVPLLKKYTCKEYLQFIFPSGEQWLDGLVHLIFFLHEEGVKSLTTNEKPQLSCTKQSVVSELESVASHEEEALFGNLFAEVRPTGLVDSVEQPTSLGSSPSSSQHGPIQLAADLICFMKISIFSPEWCSATYMDACRKFNFCHLDQFLSILKCRVCFPDESSTGNTTSFPSENKLLHINAACFELLQSFLVCDECPASLREDLVEKVFNFDNGKYTYNHYTLALVAHAMTSAANSGFSLGRKIFVQYVGFLLEKANDTPSSSLNISDFYASLPCAFHLEILLVAFHLTTESEKADLLKIVLSTLEKMKQPPPGVTAAGLTRWALLLSRLLLVLRHMLLYPLTHPSWLFMRLRSRLRDIQLKEDQSRSMNDCLPSLATVIVEGMLDDSVKKYAVTSNLLPQLIDVTPTHAEFYFDKAAVETLGLNLTDLGATMSQILNSWSGRSAKVADDLIVERYLFLICWSTLSCIGYRGNDALLLNDGFLNPDFADVNVFLTFALSISNGASGHAGVDLPALIFGYLKLLHSDILGSSELESWDFPRRGAWLSFILFLINASLWGQQTGGETEVGSHRKQEVHGEELFALGKSLFTYITENSGHCFDVLSSILETYLHTFKKTYLSFLDSGRPSLDNRYASLLLKHSAFDKSKHHLLFENFGSYLEMLEPICELSSRIDGVATKLGDEEEKCSFLKCLLHGFPSDYTSSNSALLSCILVINEIMQTFDGYIKVTRSGDRDQVGEGVISKLLGMVMTVKSDRIFRPVHRQCDSIFMSLINNRDDLARYSELFVLKQLEGFLADINKNESMDSGVKEILVSTVVDLVEDLRSKTEVFKFFFDDAEGAPEGASRIFASERAAPSVFIDVLDKCKSEQVNLKILHLFTDILGNGFCPGLKRKLQNKFVRMEVPCFSSWLEFIILGPSVKVESTNGTVGPATRELAVDFFIHLICPSSETLTKELQHHLFNSMVLLLDKAFLSHDLQTAKSYFHFIVQLSSEESHFKHLFEQTLMLMEKMVEDEGMLHTLKFLFSFVEAVFGDTGLNRSALKRLSSKTSGSSFGSGSLIPKQLKNSENLVIHNNEESNPAVDCDASSGEEDEDDGTSDGELGSIDRDEEDDGNSDRALASKVCTFTSSGSNFMEQHWYFCYTCDLTVSKGCCSVCAKVCHRGHRVVYSRSSRFFCDCGAGGVRGSSCQCLKPRKFTGTSSVPSPAASSFHPILPYHEDVEQVVDSGSDFEDDIPIDADTSMKLSVPKGFSDELPLFIKNLDIEVRMLGICKKLLPTILSHRELNLLKDRKVLLGGDVVVSHSSDIFQLKKAFKSGSLDLKIKADYPNSRELKLHLANGSLAKSLLSISTRGKLAVGEGDKVAIFDVGQIIGQPTAAPITADKTNVKPLSRNIVRFEIVHLVFNPLVDHYLAVAGYDDCQVLTLNSRGEVTDRLAIELALQGAYIRRVEWVPGSQVQLMVVTNMFAKIYDLSQDNISPMHYFTVADDIIVDATLVPSSMGKLVLLVLSEGGLLYRLNVALAGNIGAKILTETVLVKDAVSMNKGLSLYFSITYRLLFVSHQNGTTFMGCLDADSSSVTELSYICEEDHDGKSKPAGLYRWRELVAGSGTLTCLSKFKSNAPLAVSLGPHELVAQNMRQSTGSNSVVGVAAYKPLSKDGTHCLLLYDDGSLHIYSHTPSGGDSSTSLTAEQTKKLGSSILSSRAYAGTKPEFPLDFFEKTICITCDVKFSSDTTKSGDSESIKQRLTSDDGYLESLTSAGFKVTISNPNPDIVMVGCRIHVGNTSAGNIPSEITIFHRAIKLDEGMRSWYDIPFTTAESLLADEEFTITVGRTFDSSSIPRIDSIEVYSRAKDEFGWKEKMDALLDMEALGGSSAGGRSGKRPQVMQAAPIQEQVLADALRILSCVYLLCRPSCFTDMVDAGMEFNNLKCRALLETIFQSDREPLLHSVACRVLQAVFPKKDMYYHFKDTMRLLGVIKSLPAITSRIGVGGAASSWVIKEFIAQIHTISKVALHRKLNLASFLETHELVDGLMQVFWCILDLDRPETQTINSLVVPCVEFIYSYAECLALHSKEKSGASVAPAVALLKKLLFAPYEAVQTSSSLAISSRFLQVPFPKQTMIANDDGPEHQAKAGASATNSTSGNAQVMIEEDPATSSVQYCCDGCSTVPILRQRWHCNICPDFDLCETCYEILDADRLPVPHSKDHPMSAIPIELDTFGGEGNEIHFSIDELTDSGALRAPADRSVQTSPSSIHVLDASESADFPESITDQMTVSISESKRAINALLLNHLIEELRGWMGTTAGTRAIPIMQLFYRLSSAVGGPFMDSSKPENLDLEKFVKWLMEEINISKPFPAKTRCSFGEVSILVFMFFTLMFRNWHQPGSDSSHSKSSGNSDLIEKGPVQVPAPTTITLPSYSGDQDKNEFASQLVRACSTLRQQSFLNYLMDILQQLVHAFKSSSINGEAGSSGSGCGSLLTIRRELPAGNFSPFFSDSYAKSHPTDLFMDYYKLLLENTFRLVYSMVRPEKEKSAEKDRSCKVPNTNDLKLDGYQDVLCSYISNPHTTFVRRYARRLFLHLCGSKTHYYSVRDLWQYSHEVEKLHKIINKSVDFRSPVPYERSVKLIKCLCTLCDVAAARPKNWQKFCLKHMDLLPFLMDIFYHFSEECIIQTLKLLNLAFYSGKDANRSAQKPVCVDVGGSTRTSSQSSDSKKKRKGDDGSEGSPEKSCMDMEQVVEMFNDKEGDVLKRFVDIFLLEWNSAGVRHEAKCVLFGMWYHAKNSLRETMLTILLQKVKYLPMYGQNIVEYTDLITCLLGKVNDSSEKQNDYEFVNKCLTSEVISCIFDTLHSQNELLANHPNSRIYNTLSCLVEFDGYYLESEPCVTCSCPDVPYSRMKLESLKSETKFTDNRIIIKCTGSFTIQSVTMNVYDARKSKSVKVLNLYYNNRPVTDLSELKNNWSLWKRAKSCHLTFNQTELKVEFPIPITACNFMIELDSFYENLQASSLESLQCPRCSRSVTDKHGICSNCHENAYQCRQCRNINYENLDSFLCNECGYSKYGRFEFHFMAKPSFSFDNMENDDDMRKGLAAIESESENAHRRYQQLMGFKKPLIKLVSSIGEQEIDSQQKDAVQQMMVSLPGPTCKVNRKIALLGVLYGEKCKAAFDSVSRSVQTLQGLRRVLMTYLHHKNSSDTNALPAFSIPRSPSRCYGCSTMFVTQCLELLQVLSKHANCRKQLVSAGILSELFENNIHHGPRTAQTLARAVLSSFSEGDADAVQELNNLIQKKVMYCLEHHRSMDIAQSTREELLLLSEACALVDEFWEARLRVAFLLLFSSIKVGAKHPAISEHIILPCLRIISQACTPPKSDGGDKEAGLGKSSLILQSKNDDTTGNTATNIPSAKIQSDVSGKSHDASRRGQDIPLLSYSEWESGASYLDFVRRQYKVSQAVKGAVQKTRHDSQKSDYLVLKYGLRWKRRACQKSCKSDFSKFALGSWVSDLILSSCSQSIRSEICTLISLLCPSNSPRQFQLLNLLVSLLPRTLSAGESAAEYFELLGTMIDSEASRLFLTARGCLTTLCSLITKEVSNVESQERSLSIDISQGFILHKLVELLNKFLEIPNIRARFISDRLLSEVLEAFLVICGLVVQKTKLINDCNCLLKDLLDSLLIESTENKRQFIQACISGLQKHVKEKKRRTSLFILEQLCNLICPVKPEPSYLLILNKAHTQEEFIRGSMTKNPYSSVEIGPLMRDVKNKICHQLDLIGLLEDDYGMELLVGGNIISLDLSISQIYEQVWRKHHGQTQHSLSNASMLTAAPAVRDCPPMTVIYRLQGLDGEATEPMIKELEEEREESQDPEIEFAIAGAVRECGGLEIILSMIQSLHDDELRSNQEELASVLNLLKYCCKIRENRCALLRLGALGLLLETARRAFSVDAMEPAEGILLIVESLTMEANESDISIAQSVTTSNEETGAGEEARKIVLVFLERLSLGAKKSNKQQRNEEMVARILPYLTYGEPAAMEALIQHFEPYLRDWTEFDRLQKQHEENPKDDTISKNASMQRSAVDNFVRVSESLKTSSCGERLKEIILEKGITKTAVDHVKENFACAEQTGFRTSAEWTAGLKLPSIALILSMLKGLAKGHLPTQKCIDEEGILPLLHALEGVPGENEIGARAENLLDTLANKENNGDGFLGEKIQELRCATRDEMRRRALKKREMLLQGLGMRQEFASDGGRRIVVSQPIIEGLDDVEEEEDGLACMVCREGYTLRPTDMLGVYAFSKRVNLGATSAGSGRGDCVYTTVSHFNIIHYQCHQEAKRADAALKNPKKEWDGATLRNNETLCNCIFPLRGPSVPHGQYTRCVDQYWDQLNSLGRADGSRLRLLTYDIVLMLARFATGASFSTDCKGGGRESNSRFLPFMVQMASHLVDGSANQQRHAMARAVTTYLSISPSTTESPVRLSASVTGSRGSSCSSEETVQFMMVYSLLSESYESWLQHRPAFLQRGIYHAYMQHKHGRSKIKLSSDSSSSAVRSDEGSSADTNDNKKLFAIVQPMLVYTGLIEQLQQFFKKGKSSGLSRPSDKDESGGHLEKWEILMKEKLGNMKEMVGLAKDLLSWLEDMTSSDDLQEAFDVMGALTDVFSSNHMKCEDFVRAAIHAGRS
ncbi:auxin transport protein BIG-like isoform X2 [Phragmites australis]|uniref:auxin transport protein BIG-like isoform X2 n=1 Tax=Phragmites australis TaxID=29695 RepID=UPI002D785052|nr:auxin transport protein BIG-like isoform X2 [Phragmites australis]